MAAALKSKCCPCNGKNARCKSCVCCKMKRKCSSCLPMKSNCCFNSNISPSASAPEPPSKSSPRASSSPTQVQHQMNSMNNSHLNLDVHVSCSPTLVQPQMHLRAAFQEHSSPSLRPHTSTLQPESLEPMLSASHRNSIPVRGHCNVDQVHVPIDQELHKEPCIVEGCKERIAPSMWLLHMTNHAKRGPSWSCSLIMAADPVPFYLS